MCGHTMFTHRSNASIPCRAMFYREATSIAYTAGAGISHNIYWRWDTKRFSHARLLRNVCRPTTADTGIVSAQLGGAASYSIVVR